MFNEESRIDTVIESIETYLNILLDYSSKMKELEDKNDKEIIFHTKLLHEYYTKRNILKANKNVSA